MSARAAASAVTSSNGTPRLQERYRKELAPRLKEQFKHKSVMSVVRLEKIVLNIGCGEAAHDAKVLEAAQTTLETISGQKPVVTRERKAISNFRIKEGDAVGCKVTLRRARMYEFLDRLIHVALPRIRDFRGFSPRGFDGNGSYSFGLQEQVIFPEVNLDQVHTSLGMDIVMVTTSTTREEAPAMLKGFGFLFTTPPKKAEPTKEG